MHQVIILGSFLVVTLAYPKEGELPLKKRTSPRKETDTFQVSPVSRKATPPAEESQEAPSPGVPYVAGVDIYGTERLDHAKLERLLGAQYKEVLKAATQETPKNHAVLTKALEKIQAQYHFAFADWSVVFIDDIGEVRVYLTLDVVEEADRARRLAFLPKPTQTFPEPGAMPGQEGLIAAQSRYDQLGTQLAKEGKIVTDSEQPRTKDCPAAHCPFGYKHAALKPFLPIFVQGVQKHAAQLIEIAEKEARPEWRSNALFLLAFLAEDKKLVQVLTGRLKDPDSITRNNALRVLGDIAATQASVAIPAGPLVAALEDPRTEARAKALFALWHLTGQSPKVKEELRAAVPNLIRLMQSSQPDQRDFAYALLRKVSGKTFPMDDLNSWRLWQKSQTKL